MVHELAWRVGTSAVAGGFFLWIYFYAQMVFEWVLASLLIYVLIAEWPLLLSPRRLLFWLVTPLYPVLPFILLMYLHHTFRAMSWFVPLYPFLAAWISDTAAYMIGKQWGFHKMVPRISPGKSWEGLMAGIVALSGANWLWWHEHISGSMVRAIVLVVAGSTLLVIIGFCGDIFVSYLKRRAGLKDTGALLPGHGGVLDRFDSVLGIGSVVAGMLFIWCRISGC